jgi:hypothetical protein
MDSARTALSALVTICLLLPASTSHAGREPEDWDHLPQMVDVAFSSRSVGFVASDGRRFLLDRASLRFERIGEGHFRSVFSGSAPKPAETLQETGIGSVVLLRASNGLVLRTRNAYCSEGSDTHHELRAGDRIIDDHVHPCTSVSAIEAAGDQLWLGTRLDAEYGDYPAEGVVIQSLSNGSLIQKLGREDGLAGNLVRVVRGDPHDRNMWIATERGFSEIDRRLRIVTTRYFTEDFDPASGEPRVMLSADPRPSEPLAVVAREMSVGDPKGFYEATRTIPESIRSGISMDQLNSYMHISASQSPFLPEEMNVLVPFVLEAARSEDPSARRAALRLVCMFNHPRILFFVNGHEMMGSYPDPAGRMARDCIGKYRKEGILTPEQLSDNARRLLLQERYALAKIRSTRPNLLPPVQPTLIAIDAARTLEEMGNSGGIDLLNEYFAATDASKRDQSLFRSVVQRLVYADEITPMVLVALQKFEPWSLHGACSFFDMRYEELYGTRYDARYAEALLVGLDRMLQLADSKGAASARNFPMEKCTAAFQSQVGDSRVRATFSASVLPQLSPSQKDLAGRLLP